VTRAGEKMLTTVLASTCGVLFLLGLALQFGVGRGYHWLPADTDPAAAGATADVDRNAYQLPPRAEFAVIDQRPLFNEDRKPSPEESADATPEAPPPSPLNISLTGTMLVGKPELHVAIVRENGKAQSIALKEGMPLPGDQGAWTLSRVKTRSAVFKSSGGEEVEVELAVGNPGQKPGAPARPGSAPATPAAGRPPPGPAVPLAPPGPETAQAGELQQRIEERRKQMREAAERMKAQRQQDQTNPPQHP
jgi:general secretion pathway protein N